jgi:AraC-like DNA-binding protein
MLGNYQRILPADVYVSRKQGQQIRADRAAGIPHPEVKDIRLTGNSFMDLFARHIDGGFGTRTKEIARSMGVGPRLLSPAVEAMSGLTAHEWAAQYIHMKAVDLLPHYAGSLSELSHHLGFVSEIAFSHFFRRREHCSPTDFRYR